MESYETLHTSYEKIKEAYNRNPSTDIQDSILHNIENILNELKDAIVTNDDKKSFELTVKAKMFLDGFKLFSTKNPD